MSAAFLAELFRENSGEVAVMLLTIVHPDLTQTILLSSDNRDMLDFETQARGTLSRGKAYGFFPMAPALPEDAEDAAPVVQIALDNVGQEMTDLLQSTTSPAIVTIEVVAASSPDVVEMTLPEMQLTSVDVDAHQVTLSLTVDPLMQEPFPADNFTPASFPSLWGTT
ncbi:DUF1833 family protein [Mangrovibrevibacter kandeliae]|uniref:DUF1833 family protein n=1 Tax=Mangrovibrevibacter kandeliae TaxID=2968473 RepID=UPI002118430F|nr:DUF1833 family protein [Aurantimonas sp. CSK15Z-1]MCQ8781727.1 DUF1833 domain-containing protein [Aurantimonas sp. CSK15Z-1]